MATRRLRLPAMVSFVSNIFVGDRSTFERVGNDFFSIIPRRVLCYEDTNNAVFPPYPGAKEEGVKRTINAMTI